MSAESFPATRRVSWFQRGFPSSLHKTLARGFGGHRCLFGGDFPRSSERFCISLLNHVDLLKSFPYIGSPVVGRPGIRQLIHTPIMIYYRVNAERKLVEILNVWHGARDDISF